MFFSRKHFIEFGYQVMGLDFGSNNTYNHYVKYFPKYDSMVVCSTIHNNKVMVYRLTKEQYYSFQKGDFALSHDGKGCGTTPIGHSIKNYDLTVIFEGGNLTRKKRLKDILDVAEDIAQGKDVKYEFKIKRQ